MPQSLSCVDCHGGNGTATTKAGGASGADVPRRVARPRRTRTETYTLLNHERHEWIRFVNPSDLRVAPDRLRTLSRRHRPHRAEGPDGQQRAGLQHRALQQRVGAVQGRDVRRELHAARRAADHPHHSAADRRRNPRPRASCPVLLPLPRFEIGQPGNIFRIFERGGGPKSELGNPEPRRRARPAGRVRPAIAASARRPSVDPVILGAQKVRLERSR